LNSPKADVFEIYEQALETLEKQVQPLVAEYREQMQCRKGCSSCCRDGFTIRTVEAMYLFKGLMESSPETLMTAVSQLSNPAKQEDGHNCCPLLIEGACSVYAHRPVLCRAYGLIVKLRHKIATCPLNFEDALQGQIKVFDLVPYYDLLDELSNRMWQEMPELRFNDDAESPHLSISKFLKVFLSQENVTPE
jgi:Fe-S-cluster containining protein